MPIEIIGNRLNLTEILNNQPENYNFFEPNEQKNNENTNSISLGLGLAIVALGASVAPVTVAESTSNPHTNLHISPADKARCKAQKKAENRAYTSCQYPFEYSQGLKEYPKWMSLHKLAKPDEEKLKDRQLIFFKDNPKIYKRYLKEGEAGIRYKSSNTWLWDKVNDNECRDTWNCDTGNGYYGGLQMDAIFEEQYNSSAVELWGHSNNWPKNAQVLAADRAYSGYGKIRARGLSPWPSSNAEFGTYPVKPHKTK